MERISRRRRQQQQQLIGLGRRPSSPEPSPLPSLLPFFPASASGCPSLSMLTCIYYRIRCESPPPLTSTTCSRTEWGTKKSRPNDRDRPPNTFLGRKPFPSGGGGEGGRDRLLMAVNRQGHAFKFFKIPKSIERADGDRASGAKLRSLLHCISLLGARLTATRYGEVEERSFYVYRFQGIPIPLPIPTSSSSSALIRPPLPIDVRLRSLPSFVRSFVRSVVPVPSFVIA